MANQPKKYKKFVATAATATLVASAIVPVASAKSFNDVADNNDHKANIDKISDLGYMGTGDNFNPGGNLTRGQVAIILANWAKDAAGKTVPADYKTAQRFEDVALTADDKLLQSAALVFDNEIFSGSNGNLLPANNINRLQMALVLNKAYEAIKGVSLVELAGDTSDVVIGDLDKIPAEHQGVVKALKKLGITAPANFNPTGEVTRGQFATFFIKTLEAEAPELKVNSVSAINANEILVTFNTELDKTSAENEANYTIDAAALAGADEVTLRSDKKSVIIKLDMSGAGVLADGLLDNNTAYEIAVNKNLLAVNGNTLGTDQSKTLLFQDSTKPTVTSVSSDESGDVTVTFSERLKVSTVPTIVLNEVTVNPANVTVNANGTVTIAAADAAVAALTKNTSYPVVVYGAQDLIGNTMNLYSSSFTYVINNEAPEVVSVQAAGETTIEVKFDEVLNGNLVDGTTVKVYKGAALLTSVPTTTDNKTFAVDLAYGDVFAAGETLANLRVVLEGYKDAQQNFGVKYETTLTLQKDTVKPVAQKAEYNAATGLVTVTFSEGLAAETATTYAPKLFVTDLNGVKYDVVDPANVTADTELITTANVLAGEKTVVFNASEFANGTYNLTIGAGAFSDEANTPNTTAAHTVQFVKGNASDAGKPTVTAVGEVTKGQFTVTFSEPVKGGAVAGSATDYTNYKINGVTLPAGTTIYLNAAKTIATITVPEGTVVNTGTKLVSVANVQDLAGNVLDTDTRTANLTDNAKPVLTSAKVLNGSEIELTFSEAVTASFDYSDFVVTVNGANVTEAAGVTAASASNKLVISVTNANLATGTIVVKVDDAANAADAASNVIVTGTTVTATR